MCDEGNQKHGRHAAYNIGNEPIINFCPDYFELQALDLAVDGVAKFEQTKLDLTNYYNRGKSSKRLLFVTILTVFQQSYGPGW
jgi:hypothetical protein